MEQFPNELGKKGKKNQPKDFSNAKDRKEIKKLLGLIKKSKEDKDKKDIGNTGKGTGFEFASFGFSSGKSNCHKGNKPVFDIALSDKTYITVYGAGSYRDANYWQDNIILLQLANNYDADIEVLGMPDTFNLESINTPRIRIEWKDGGVPYLDREVWDKILLTIKAQKKDVLVSCIGGHGRTGTALAILAALSGACKEDEDPIEFVRDIYCKYAVEKKIQCEYVEDIIGRPVTRDIHDEWEDKFKGYGVVKGSKLDKQFDDELPKRGGYHIWENGEYKYVEY